MSTYSSSGIIQYGYVGSRIICLVDKELVRYYQSLIPKWIRWQPQKHAAHITVVRELKEKIRQEYLGLWGKYEGKSAKFEYNTTIHSDETYFWLNCHSVEFENIRVELGLEKFRMNGSFHISLCNRKLEKCTT